MEYAVEVPMPRDEHAGLRDGLLRSCGLHPPVVSLAAPDAAMRLLACARVASVDDREAYFAPAALDAVAAKIATRPARGERDAVALSPRNETAACALLLELLAELPASAAAAVLPDAVQLCDAALAPPLPPPPPPPPPHHHHHHPPPRGRPAGRRRRRGRHARVGPRRRRRRGTPRGPRLMVAATTIRSRSRTSPPRGSPPHGRGAAAAADIPAGADCLRVPSSALWTVQVALDDPGPRGEAYRTFAALGEDALAALWLVFERALGDRSPWAPLVRSLPPRRTEAETDARDGASFPGTPAPVSTPLSWSPAATRILLGGTPLLADAEAHRARFANQYDALFPALSDGIPDVFPRELYTRENVAWATEVWNAYGMTVQLEDGEGGEQAPPRTRTCLPPAALLCNHALWPHCVRYSRLRRGALHLPVARSVKRGEEVFVSYGAKSNAELLLFYGFALREPNPYDETPLALELPRGEPAEATAARAEALARCGLALAPHAVRAEGPPPRDLVAVLRVLTVDAAELGALGPGGGGAAGAGAGAGATRRDPRMGALRADGEAAAARARARAGGDGSTRSTGGTRRGGRRSEPQGGGRGWARGSAWGRRRSRARRGTGRGVGGVSRARSPRRESGEPPSEARRSPRSGNGRGTGRRRDDL